MKRFESLNDEEQEQLEHDTHIESAEVVLSSDIYSMLKDIYQVDATTIGDVENEMIYGRERKPRKN